jgi:predicted nucleic acid-binding Zn ribbon protein
MKPDSRHNDKNKIEDLLEVFLQKYHLNSGLLQVKIEKIWEEQMGQGIASYTQKVVLKNDTLILYLTSAALREELSYGKDKIIKILNEALGREIIKEIKLL